MRKRPATDSDRLWTFPQVKAGVVGLPGLEPGTSSWSEMDGEAPC